MSRGSYGRRHDGTHGQRGHYLSLLGADPVTKELTDAELLARFKAEGPAGGSGPEVEAIRKAEEDPRVQKLAIKLLGLELNWHPKPTFKKMEIYELVGECTKLLTEARKAIQGTPTNFVSDGLQMQRERLSEITRRGVEAIKFMTVAAKAKTDDELIRVDDLKPFVLRCYRTAFDAYVTSIVLWNHTVDTLKYLASFEARFDFLVFAAKKYAGHLADVAKGVWDYGKYAIIGGVALLGAIVIGKAAGGGSRTMVIAEPTRYR